MVEQLTKTRYILLNTSLYKSCTRYLFKEVSCLQDHDWTPIKIGVIFLVKKNVQ